MDQRTKLKELLERKTATQVEALQLFDELQPADIPFMKGVWKGAELKTGHPMDGLLAAAGWYGKTITDAETVDPLVFTGSRGLFRVNPGLIPMSFPFGLVPRRLAKALLPRILPLLKTNKARARIRMLDCRGVVSAAMIYDQKPIIDAFRKVDERTVLGMMDLKGQKQAYFFVLERIC